MTAALGRADSEQLPNLCQLADLEPLSTGDLIDRAVLIYRSNFAPLLGLALLPVLTSCAGTLLVVYVATGLHESAGAALIRLIGFIVGYLLTYVISPVLLALTTGGLTRTVADCIMLDIPVGFRRTWRMVRGRLWTLLWSQLVSAVIFWFGLSVVALSSLFILSVVVLAVMLSLSYVTSVFAGSLVLLLVAVAIGLGFIGYCAMLAQVALVPSVVMIEGRSTWDSIVRAVQLARGTVWRVTQITLFDMAIASSVISAVGIPLLLYVFLNGEFRDLTRAPMWFLLFSNLADQLGKLVTLPMATIAYCLLYFDVRVRREGYDVELLGARLEGPLPPGRTPTQLASAPPTATIAGAV